MFENWDPRALGNLSLALSLTGMLCIVTSLIATKESNQRMFGISGLLLVISSNVVVGDWGWVMIGVVVLTGYLLEDRIITFIKKRKRR